MRAMSEEVWRPLGVESPEEVARYDALHDGVPPWMEAALWNWVKVAISRMFTDSYGTRRPGLDIEIFEQMCQRLHIAAPDLRMKVWDGESSEHQRREAMMVLRAADCALQIADYLLAFGKNGGADELQAILERSGSAYRVGRRAQKPGLLRRVPESVQAAADAIMDRSERGGTRLAEAWEKLYGLDRDFSGAYSLAIKAVEDACIPVVSPNNGRATLGTVIRDMRGQPGWSLPMKRAPEYAPPGHVVVGMLQVLWTGQLDRHGGAEVEGTEVSEDEARVAVDLAVILVDWFSGGLVTRVNPD